MTSNDSRLPAERSRISRKAALFTESVIREMTRLAAQHSAINLAQGFPDFAAPGMIKDAACAAIQADINQYAVTWGSPRLRQALVGKYKNQYNWDIDADTEITVACGATECMVATMLALVDPGDCVLVFEPYYENYGPDAVIAGAEPLFIPLDPQQNWAFDVHALEQKIVDSLPRGGIRALILNTPNNPSGKVFSSEELLSLAGLAQKYDFYIITDEIYEHIIYEGSHHLTAALPGMRERTITISGLSKTFSVTGWRIGYIIAPPDLTSAIRKMHDFLTVGAAAPLQEAAAEAVLTSPDYYTNLHFEYRQRRDFITNVLKETGFRISVPAGAYYVMADISALTDMSDVDFVRHLIQEYGVATVPGSSFYHRPEQGRTFIRFAFCKSMGLLEQAAERLRRLA